MRNSFYLLLLAAAWCMGQTNPFAKDPHASDLGKGAFRIYCSPCHGIQAQGGRGPDLTRGTYHSGDLDSDLFRTISKGIPGSDMEPYGGVLTDDNIWRIVAYIRSNNSPDKNPVRGDAGHGERLFWEKGNCGQCHTVGARGGKSGPDLTRIGRARSAAYLKNKVLAPSSELTPGYDRVTVVLKDGRKITGVAKGFDNFSAQLMDSDDHFYSYARNEVASMDREDRSLMPETYGRLFNPTELNDLLAFLTNLRGEARQ